jgi:CRP/FNR family transcriptional regulator
MPAYIEFLKSIQYFKELGDEQIARLAKAIVELSFDRGQVIILEGEPCRGLYVARSGRVRVFKTSPDGREQVLLMTRPGDTFNFVPVFDGGPNPASAAALDAAVVYLIPKEALVSLVADCPAARTFLKLLAGRLRHMTSVVEALSFRTVVSRLAKLLLDRAVVEGGAAPVRQLTQDEMAAVVGTVRDVIGRALKRMQTAGAVKIDRNRILIISPGELRKMI